MFLKRICARLDSSKVDNEILERSRLARVGARAIRLSVIIQAIEPALAVAAAICLMSAQALAQQTGGNIFGGNDQVIGSGVREAIRYGRNLLFLLGVGGVGWGAVNYMMEKAWIKQMIGGGMSMGLGGIASLIYSFSQGNAVDLNTDLGN
ncbi:MAG: hypothetical protein MOB07_13015 [Acidobacteria bacterium]|nr:hypothetical protein [Acidobacteriota bacterium]